MKPYTQIVREARERANLTHDSVGKALGLHRNTISNIESGRPVTFKTLFKVANYLGAAEEEMTVIALTWLREQALGCNIHLPDAEEAKKLKKRQLAVAYEMQGRVPSIIAELGEQITNINRSNGWGVTTPGDKTNLRKIATNIALIHSEASEALEALRHKEGPDWNNFCEEMADIVIRVIDTTAGLGYNIGQDIISKLEKNSKRGYRHGGKAI